MASRLGLLTSDIEAPRSGSPRGSRAATPWPLPAQLRIEASVKSALNPPASDRGRRRARGLPGDDADPRERSPDDRGGLAQDHGGLVREPPVERGSHHGTHHPGPPALRGVRAAVRRERPRVLGGIGWASIFIVAKAVEKAGTATDPQKIIVAVQGPPTQGNPGAASGLQASEGLRQGGLGLSADLVHPVEGRQGHARLLRLRGLR